MECLRMLCLFRLLYMGCIYEFDLYVELSYFFCGLINWEKIVFVEVFFSKLLLLLFRICFLFDIEELLLLRGCVGMVGGIREIIGVLVFIKFGCVDLVDFDVVILCSCKVCFRF